MDIQDLCVRLNRICPVFVQVKVNGDVRNANTRRPGADALGTVGTVQRKQEVLKALSRVMDTTCAWKWASFVGRIRPGTR